MRVGRLASFPALCLLLTLASCGDLNTAPEHAPGFSSVSAGMQHSCAVDTDGLVWCWGNSEFGRLGWIGTDPPCTGDACLRPVPVTGNAPMSDVEVGDEHSCAIQGGAAVCWGLDWMGQLGDAGTATQKCRLLPCSVEPMVVALGYPLRDVTAGGRHSCAITDDLRAFCWGWARFHALGDGVVRESTSFPVEVAGDHRFRQISGGTSHTCAIDVDDRAWCWGSDNEGRLGLGEVPARTSVPTPEPVAGDLRWRSIDAGLAHTCGVSVDGVAYCFGQGYRGRLGDGPGTHSVVPVRVAIPGDGVVQLSTGGTHACAVTSEGAAWCWGGGSAGELGIGNSSDVYVPVRVQSPDTFVEISAGLYHTCAVTDDDRLFCWGDSDFGQLGVGDREDRFVPTLVE